MVSIWNWGMTMRDARGQTARVRGYINLSGSGADPTEGVGLASAIVTAIDAMSNAVTVATNGLAQQAGGGQVLNPDQYGTNAEYPNAEDKAVLTFLMANNTLSRLSIPAPKLAIFMTDGETVNLSNSLVAALEAALTAVGGHLEEPCTKNGSSYNQLVSGSRSRRRFQRKTTIWTLTPEETDPEE